MDTTNKVSFPSIKDVPAEAWQKLSQKKIYFGHQSVGQNIVDGIQDVMRENPHIKLTIVQTRNPSDVTKPLFAHSAIGKNDLPQSKIEDFSELMKKGFGDNVDVAFFKLCFVDITDDTEISKLFQLYKATVNSLAMSFPKTTFIHVTVPLTSKPKGIDAIARTTKNLVKKLLGMPIYDYNDNAKRGMLNDLLRQEYLGKEPLFDLAMIESTLPDGTRIRVQKKGLTFFTLANEYTDDGGHLNGMGKKIIAEQLLLFLAKL